MKPFVLVALLLGSPMLAVGQDGKPLPTPPDIALVPNDALAVVHVKISDLWQHDAMKDVRDILEKAGAKALKTFNERYAPLPSTAERFTAYLLLPSDKARSLGSTGGIVAIVTFSKPFDKAAVVKKFAEKATLKKGKLGEYYEDDDGLLAVRFLDAKTLAFGTPSGIDRMVNTPLPVKDGPLSAALTLASGPRPVVIGINTNFLGQEELNDILGGIPEPLQPMFKARSMTFSLDLEKDGHIHAAIAYADKQLADDAEKALNAALSFAKEELENVRARLEDRLFMEGKPTTFSDFSESAALLAGMGGLKHIQDVLDRKPLKREGNNFALTLPLPKHVNTLVSSAAIALVAATPSVGEVQVAANRVKASNNLKQIALAFHNYHDANGMMVAAITDKGGKPLLSWRVALLPYIEQDNLFREFKLDEPWDSAHNKKLIEKMPAIYSIPGNKDAKPNMAYYRVFTGNGALFDLNRGTRIPADITDGTSNTLLAVEAEEGVIWTKPEDFPFDPAKELPKFGKFFKGGFNAAMADGSVRFMKPPVDPKRIKAMITRAGGEITD